jgi:hypothetical protein
MDFTVLKEYIDDSQINVSKLKDKTLDLSEQDRIILVYEIYANFVDLIDASKDILIDIRKNFKVTDKQVKKWMAENDALDDSNLIPKVDNKATDTISEVKDASS